MDINLHGRNIDLNSLIKASTDTFDTNNHGYVELLYDQEDGKVWAKYHAGGPLESWTNCRGSVICVGCVQRHISAQRLADLIDEEIEVEAAAQATANEEAAKQAEFEAWIDAEFKAGRM